MTRPDTLLQVLSKAFNTNPRACQENFYAAKANYYRHLGPNKVAYTNKVRRRSSSKRFSVGLLMSGKRDGRELGRQDEAERAHERRLLAQSRGDYLRGWQAAADALAHGLANLAHYERPRADYGAADYHGLGREPLRQVGDAEPEEAPGLLERGHGVGVASEREVYEQLEVHAHAVLGRALESVVARERGALRGERLPAASAARGARDGRALANRHVAELARRAALAAVDLPVEDDACADALLDQNHYEVANLSNLGSAEPKLRERGGVGVVVGADGEVGGGANLARDV